MNIQMNRSVRFWDRFAERYARQPIADEDIYQEKLRITREFLRPDMSVLEFGCGTGSTALLHAPYVQRIRAVDSSARMIEIARGKADAQNVKNVAFEVLSIEDLPAAGESYDAVLGLNILHLLENKREAIAKVYELLAPGGVFVASTACIADNMKFIKFVEPLGVFFGLMPPLNIFTTAELEAALREAGFTIERRWSPGKGKAVFTVAQKPAARPAKASA